MAAPGVIFRRKDFIPPRSAPTDTSPWFVVGETEKGVLTPVRIQSMDDYDRLLGDFVSYGMVYDALDVFFREGGSAAYVSRVVSSGAVTAFVNLSDGTANTLKVSANSPGAWGNSLRVQVIAGTAAGSFVLIISHSTEGELERSPDLADKTAAINWSARSGYVTVTDMAGTGDPAVVAATPFATGADDRAGINDASWQAALDRITNDLGPGQVSMPGRTTTVAHTALLAHANAQNRVALLDLQDTATVSTLTAATSALRALGTTRSRFGGAFAPWAVVPGALTTETRKVPYSAVQAGMIARQDRLRGQNDPAAGADIQAQFAVGLSQPAWTESERETLNEAGVNVARIMFGAIETYGYRTLTDPKTDENWLPLTNARLAMSIQATIGSILERYTFKKIDGRGHLFVQLGGELQDELMRRYTNDDLFGETPEEAFVVDTGPSVNTPTTIALRQVNARVAVRMSTFGEVVIFDITKVPVATAVS